jgi:3-isopropylmalate/(R)-2-methylmalate dehydratase small subunit
VTFDGLGAYAFHDVRFDTDGRPTGHPLDDPRYRGASILVAGRNFGCGSSREHAPQSLYYAGFRAVVADSFAEIFFGNATTLGIPCVALERSDREALARSIAERPSEEMEIDVANATVRFAGRELAGRMPESTRRVLTEGQWDPLAQLLDGRDAVTRVTKRIPPPPRAA